MQTEASLMEKGDDIKDEIGIFKFLSKRDLWNSQLSSHSPESVRYNLVVCGNSSSIKMKLIRRRFFCFVITAIFEKLRVDGKYYGVSYPLGNCYHNLPFH